MKSTRHTCAALPTPTEAALALPGLAFSQAINSFALLAGKSLRATIQSFEVVSSATGSKSFSGFEVDGEDRDRADIDGPIPDIERVAVRRRARATRSSAMVPAAPAWFSTITLSPRVPFMCSASTRAVVSVGPPGGKPTTRVIGLDGNFCAWAPATPARAMASDAANGRILMHSPC